ncbi:MAG: Gfo/Idh/MocA family oxidoreductase [bacterium]|nr:Gfo/Idh/MocA family oxidoreductase [bacterium]
MNLGFIGLGNYSRNHQRAVENNSTLRLAAVYDPVSERMQAAAETFGAKQTSSVHELASNSEIDAVVITTPNALHFEHFSTCVENGKHVFVNVPAATDRKEGEQMLLMAEQHGVVYMAGHNLRKNPAIVRLKKILAAEELGTLHSVEASVGGPSGYNLTPDNWRYSKQTSPLLPFTQMAVVFIDLILNILGPPERVTAFMTKRDGAGDAPDLGTVLGQYPDGRLSYIGSSYVSQLGYEISFVGSKSKIKWDNRDNNSLTQIGPEKHREEFERIDEQYEELVEFADCITHKKTPSVSGLDAYNVAAYFEAIEKSIQTERAVRFREYGG